MVLWCLTSQAQQNLIPNASFEEYSACPSGEGQIFFANNWINILGSVDYFNSCGINGLDIPNNYVGFQPIFQREGYIGIVPWVHSVANVREFAGIELLETLKPEARYIVSLRLSLADTVGYSVRNFGFCFTETQPNNSINNLLLLEPQVSYQENNFLDDRIEWMLIEGNFIANGAESFLTIGNFDNDIETDTLQSNSQGALSSYYYIDDVSVVEDTSYHVGVNELGDERFDFNLYPNPNTGEFTVILGMDEADRAEITVWSITGQQVHTSKLSAGSNVLRLNVAQGLYIYRVTVNGELKWTGKVSISPY
jgi:hypothetical protein